MVLKIINSIYKVATVSLLNFFLFFLVTTIWLIMADKSIFIEWEIFNTNSVSIVMSMIMDWKSVSFLTTVSMVSTFIMIYSVYYMEGDKNFHRFTLILLSFVLSMMLLIISPNLVSLMLGWDGLGLTSYVLVIYYQNEYSANSGMITILSNRVGDSTLLLSIGWLMFMGSYNFLLFNKLDQVIVLLIIISAFTKSAQMPFSAWLPAAMAAPTPVSALVHSSTLVTAGVFLMIRFSPLMKESPFLPLVFLVGVMTMLMAGWSANFETDLKKVVALSTLSQLGLMFMILGFKQDLLAFFHLIMHALFKSTLFMCAGFIIHNMKSSQDSRFAGTFNFSSPILGLIFGVTNLSLCGFPFMTGFFSKDMILESSFSGFLTNFMMILVILATGFTLSYSLRAMYLTSAASSKTPVVSVSSDFSMTLMMATMLLFILSIIGGYVLTWLMITKGFMFSMMTKEKFSIITILSIMLLTTITFLKNYFMPFSSNMKNMFSSMLFLPTMTKTPLTYFKLKWGLYNLKLTDKGWMELTGPSNSAKALAELSVTINKSNYLTITAQYLTATIIILLFINLMN